METVCILLATAILIFTLFICRQYKIKQKDQQEQRKQELKKALNLACQKELTLCVFIVENQEEFYPPEIILKMEECRTGIKNMNAELKQLAEEFSKEKNAQEVEQAIYKAKKEAGFYIDLFGLEEEVSRSLMNAHLNVSILALKLQLLEMIITLKLTWISYAFGGLFQEVKADQELVERCVDFLQEEFTTQMMVRALGTSDLFTEARLAAAEVILNSMKAKEFEPFALKFAPLLKIT
jgi:actin-related protein